MPKTGQEQAQTNECCGVELIYTEPGGDQRCPKEETQQNNVRKGLRRHRGCLVFSSPWLERLVRIR